MDFYEQKGLEKVKVIERCLEKKIFEKGSPRTAGIWPATRRHAYVPLPQNLRRVLKLDVATQYPLSSGDVTAARRLRLLMRLDFGCCLLASHHNRC